MLTALLFFLFYMFSGITCQLPLKSKYPLKINPYTRVQTLKETNCRKLLFKPTITIENALNRYYVN